MGYSFHGHVFLMVSFVYFSLPFTGQDVERDCLCSSTDHRGS